MTHSDVTMEKLATHVMNGGKTELEPTEELLFKRIKFAHTQLIEHYSTKVTMRVLKAYYGEQYSDATLRKDINGAKLLFGAPQPGHTEFLSGLVIDGALEMLLKAKNDRDFSGFARIGTLIMKIGGLDKNNERPFDPATLRNPVPREIVFDPSLVGAKPDPDLPEKLKELIGDKRIPGFGIPELPEAEIVDGEEG